LLNFYNQWLNSDKLVNNWRKKVKSGSNRRKINLLRALIQHSPQFTISKPLPSNIAALFHPMIPFFCSSFADGLLLNFESRNPPLRTPNLDVPRFFCNLSKNIRLAVHSGQEDALAKNFGIGL
jgi:hypothetical protein